MTVDIEREDAVFEAAKNKLEAILAPLTAKEKEQTLLLLLALLQG